MADHLRRRAALYHRVSTREQNLRLARSELRAAAATRGLGVVLEVEETASGRGSVRPGLDRILGAAQRGEIDVVIVQRLDRFGRSTLDLLANLRRLRSAGVGFVATAQGLEVRPQHDAVSDLTFTVLAAVAEFERAVIVERTLDGLAAARRAGKKLGRPLGKSAPSPERVVALRAAGHTWPQIARRLRCTVGSARRALDRGLPKSGARHATPRPSRNYRQIAAIGTDRLRRSRGRAVRSVELGACRSDPVRQKLSQLLVRPTLDDELGDAV
ncbi:MAG TPA: recombinase family protein [Burkholderiales bacterium]|nr:recombinase family protein [Burkholderiales bacterium]